MKLTGALLILASAILPYQGNAANDVYGTVSQIITRSGDNGDTSIYFRMDVMKDNSSFENCVIDEDSLIWHLDLDSPVVKYQYELIEKSYSNKLPLRIVGHDNVCNKGRVYSDKVFELSPWSWDSYSKQDAQ
ncbi:hypothetical protein [Flocculibacter collagenilyticus]|uniref:hypothetical protein n=1 Tax=Flocculibacter collagenilyticus TaxID=2744479 RepID=UPI0018F2BDBB|nr:hypothetical protein [Flocculibacter collagenilyticus]